MEKLLTRTEFREGVFARDNHQCVICRAVGQDAHHILERRLFCDPDHLGGYFLGNGATLCAAHHLQAEETVLSCEQVREAAGITQVILPSHLYDDVRYDKWGNQIEPNGTRLRGELFYDESVQKILAQGGVLDEFLPYTRYQRTYHLPWSNMTKDDRMLENTAPFEGQEVVVTVFALRYQHAPNGHRRSGTGPGRVFHIYVRPQTGLPSPARPGERAVL